MKRYVCNICGYVYDESAGAPEVGIEPGTLYDDLPDSFVCPLCGMSKNAFVEE